MVSLRFINVKYHQILQLTDNESMIKTENRSWPLFIMFPNLHCDTTGNEIDGNTDVS